MKISNLYRFSVMRPDMAAKIVLVRPPLWKRLWYGLTAKLYDLILLIGLAIAFTGVTQAPLIGKLIYSLLK